MTRFFKLKENHTSVSTEITAGLTPFLQCRIFFLLPRISLVRPGCRLKESFWQRLLHQLLVP